MYDELLKVGAVFVEERIQWSKRRKTEKVITMGVIDGNAR
jgi:hypothetical protein